MNERMNQRHTQTRKILQQQRKKMSKDRKNKKVQKGKET